MEECGVNEVVDASDEDDDKNEANEDEYMNKENQTNFSTKPRTVLP
jgi:hypothetical protein